MLGRLHNPLDFGTNNNASSYEYVRGNITDHINLNYTYDNDDFPISRLEVSTEFGNSNSTEYTYQ